MANNKQPRGGKREGAGRPKGSGQFGEPTKAIRVPVSRVGAIRQYLEEYKSSADSNIIPFDSTGNTSADNGIPLFSSKIAAGNPTFAEDHVEETLDLNQYLVDRPESTYMLRVEGESMKDVGIMPDDILVVDRTIKARHNKIVIAAIDGELTVKRLYQRGGLIKLLPENKAYSAIEIENESELVIWGVVIGSIRRFNS